MQRLPRGHPARQWPYPAGKAVEPMALCLVIVAVSALVLDRAQAGGGPYFPPLSDPVVKEECGACRLAFAPAMLPARSWQRMMGELKSHFGDDAGVAPEVAARITDYLVANSADKAGQPYTRANCAACRADPERGQYED